jgi:hypothetical protein
VSGAPDGRPDLPQQGATEAVTIDALRAAGYGSDFEIVEGRLCVDDVAVDPGRLTVDGAYRFEGTSDPDYQSLVVALTDPEVGTRGVLITAYGPTATAAEGSVLRALPDDLHRRR